MGKWLGFLLGPVVVAVIIEFIASLVMGGLFGFAPNDWLSLIVTAFVGIVIGSAIYEGAPLKDPDERAGLAWIYAVVFIGLGIWLGLYVEGETVAIVGGDVKHHLLWSVEIAKAIGIALGVAGRHNDAKGGSEAKGTEQ